MGERRWKLYVLDTGSKSTQVLVIIFPIYFRQSLKEDNLVGLKPGLDPLPALTLSNLLNTSEYPGTPPHTRIPVGNTYVTPMKLWRMNISKWMHRAITWVWLTTLWKMILMANRKAQIMSLCDSWGYSRVYYCCVRSPSYDKLPCLKFLWHMETNKMGENDKECSHRCLSNLHVRVFWHSIKETHICYVISSLVYGFTLQSSQECLL